MMFRRLSWIAFALGFGAHFAAAGTVRIAERPMVGPFTTLQAAVNAALEGESLIVEPGTYAPFTIDGKSVQLFDTGVGEATIVGQVVVKNISASQYVVLSRLKVTGAPGYPVLLPPALEITNVSGNLRVLDSTFTGAGVTSSANTTGGAVRLTASVNVVFSNCTITSSDAGWWSGEHAIDGAPGVDSVNSSSAFYDCAVVGGHGSEESVPRGGNGGPAISCLSFGVFASGCNFRGGNGGGGDYIGCNFGGVGGDGVRVEVAQAHMLGNVYTPGSGGWSSCGPFAGGGQAVHALNGSIVDMLPSTTHRISAARISADDARLPITINGQPGDLVYLTVQRRPLFVFKKPLNGVWMVPFFGALTGPAVGTIGPSGTLVVRNWLPVPDRSAAARMYWLQAVCVGSAGQTTLTGPAHVLSFDVASTPDCNGNGRQDAVDVLFGGAADCDKNLTPDTCEPDCNGSGVPDACEIAQGLLPDCNGNGIPDACDVAAGVPDCNGNGVPDSCDIATHQSSDLNANGVPDECEATSVTWYIDSAAAPGGNGSQAAPFQSLQLGVSASFHGDTLELADGTYSGAANRSINLNGRHLSIRSANGPNNCIIDCQGAGRAFSMNQSEHVTLEGLTVVSGSFFGYGGAIETVGAQLTLRNCVVANCSAHQGGGVLNCVQGSLRLESCLFLANSVGNVGADGGVMLLDRTTLTARDCLFAYNQADDGGGVFMTTQTNASFPAAVFSHCNFLENHARFGGAGYLNPTGAGARYKFDDCQFAGNSVFQDGGALLLYVAADIRNCSFVSNHAGVRGGGICYRNWGASPLDNSLDNSILWGGSAWQGAQISLGDGSGPGLALSVGHSDIDGGQAGIFVLQSVLTWGSGNIALNPQFVDADGADNNPSTFNDNDYALSAGSPCVDAADNAAMSPDRLDIDGDGDTTEPIPLDMNLLPRRIDVLSVPDTGAGTAPIVDMGALERQ